MAQPSNPFLRHRPVGRPLLRLRRWLGGMRGDSSVPLSPNHVQAGRSQDIPDEGSLFHVSPISPGFQSRPLREAQPFPLEGVLLPSTIDDFSDSDLGAPITYAQCELNSGVGYPIVFASVFRAVWTRF